MASKTGDTDSLQVNAALWINVGLQASIVKIFKFLGNADNGKSSCSNARPLHCSSSSNSLEHAAALVAPGKLVSKPAGH